MSNQHIDKILSIIDNLFGEDDNSPVPSDMDLRNNSGFGDSHHMSRPEYTCIQIAASHNNPEIARLEAELMEVFEAGHEISNHGPSAYATRQEYIDVLNGLSEQKNDLFLKIAGLCNNYVADFGTNNSNCVSCGVDFSFHG
jgi:hypothetical protein